MNEHVNKLKYKTNILLFLQWYTILLNCMRRPEEAIPESYKCEPGLSDISYNFVVFFRNNHNPIVEVMVDE